MSSTLPSLRFPSHFVTAGSLDERKKRIEPSAKPNIAPPVCRLPNACGAVPSHLFDTQLAAGFVGMSSPSLASLVELPSGARIEQETD